MTIRIPVPRISRKLIVGFVLGALLLAPVAVYASHQFTDVPDAHTFHDDISAIADAGITSGCTATTYCPGDFVTRGQMAAFLNRLGSLDGGTPPSVNADLLDGLDSTAFVQPRWAVVDADGTLRRGSAGVTSSQITSGVYTVDFGVDITGCAWTATLGSIAGEIAVQQHINLFPFEILPRNVRVRTFDSAGTVADRAFHVVATC